uniref:ZF-HD dimerization-type domain-containing protein n=1 Tax=Solanum lycopersicum TaxID=4081 RepID=A0A3Q7GEN0_SOLLC
MTNNSSSNSSCDMIKYGICLKNYATEFGDYSVDGCREFVKKDNDETKEEYICAKCGCFRSSSFFHPHVVPHGGGNAPIIFHSFETRFVSNQYIRRPIFYYYL